LSFELGGWLRRGVLPFGLGKMDVTIPETGCDRRPGAVQHSYPFGNPYVAGIAGGGNPAVTNQDDTFLYGIRFRRGVDFRAYERDGVNGGSSSLLGTRARGENAAQRQQEQSCQDLATRSRFVHGLHLKAPAVFTVRAHRRFREERKAPAVTEHTVTTVTFLAFVAIGGNRK
jgi:hypothetical protein